MVEFAIITPVLLLIIMGIIEFSLIMFTWTVMENATANTARLGKTGYYPNGMTQQQAIIQNVQNHTAGLLDPTKITLTALSYSDFSEIGQPEPCITVRCGAGQAGVDYDDINGNKQWDSDMGAAGYGGAGDVVVYTVSYPWPIQTPHCQRRYWHQFHDQLAHGRKKRTLLELGRQHAPL